MSKEEKNILIVLAVAFVVYKAYWKGALDIINGTGVASATGAATTNYAAS